MLRWEENDTQRVEGKVFLAEGIVCEKFLEKEFFSPELQKAQVSKL